MVRLVPFLLSIILGVGAKSLFDEATTAHWCYGGSPSCGENTWSGDCLEGGNQSPIDLPSDISDGGGVGSGGTLHFHAGLRLKGFTLKNNGLNVELLPFMTDPMNEKGFHFSPLNSTYIFHSINMHWGLDNGRGSEHTIGGKRFAFELHIVFYKDIYRLFQHAMNNKEDPSAVAAIGIIFDVKSTTLSESLIKPILNSLERIKRKGEHHCEQKFDVEPLFKFEKAYWYLGSFARPPCEQNILWIVSPEIEKISSDQLELFRSLQDNNGEPMGDNFRDLSPIKNQVIRRIDVG